MNLSLLLTAHMSTTLKPSSPIITYMTKRQNRFYFHVHIQYVSWSGSGCNIGQRSHTYQHLTQPVRQRQYMGSKIQQPLQVSSTSMPPTDGKTVPLLMYTVNTITTLQRKTMDRIMLAIVADLTHFMHL